MLIATLDGPSHTVRFGSFRPGYHAGLRAFAWSPDGSTLAVIDAGTVWLVPVDGGEVRTVWTPARRQIPRAIAWTPDGSRLAIGWDVGPAMSCCDGHRPFLAVVDLADGSRTALPTAGDAIGDVVEQLAWLPGQDRIFVNYLRGSPVLVDPTGSAAPTVLDLDFRRASDLDVSPDGRWLLYLAFDGHSYAVAAEPLDGSAAPVFYSPWTLGVEYAGDFSWRPINR
jgi:WD40 repeat protein